MSVSKGSVFAAAALGFVGTAILHAISVFQDTGAPFPWRHALFVAINLGAAIGLFRFRTRTFAISFSVLTLQQLWSHGSSAVAMWTQRAQIDWVSIVVVVSMPLILGLLISEQIAPAAPWEPEAIGAAVVGALAVVLIAAIIRHDTVFEDYSARFGALSPVEFQSLNQEMSRLKDLARVSVLALFPADLLWLVLSARAWRRRGGRLPKATFFAALLVLAAVALLLLLATAIPSGPGMIGESREAGTNLRVRASL